MADEMAGFPFWELRFDESGRLVNAGEVDAFVGDLPMQQLTALFIISHGWNNDREFARGMYDRFLGQMRSVLDSTSAVASEQVRIGVSGVVWPSMRWADEDVPGDDIGGAASFKRPVTDAGLVQELKAVYGSPEQQAALDELARLLEERPEDPQALARFQELMRPLTDASDAGDAEEDQGEVALLEDDPRLVFERFAAISPRPHDEGGIAGFGEGLSRLWEGAKNALRQATYWQMKKRAGIVGQEGLAPVVRRLHESQPGLHIHLVGHSFGARLVSYALAGLSETGAASPIKSVVLLQGAFSHFAFADSLPHDPNRAGGLAGHEAKVDGPLVVSHSTHDSAVGRFYPLASIAAGQDAAAAEDRFYRWGAMGYDGAQAVGATEAFFGDVGTDYPFTPGKIVNLDGNEVITEGRPPTGAHSDIFRPEIAWATLAAAGVTAVHER